MMHRYATTWRPPRPAPAAPALRSRGRGVVGRLLLTLAVVLGAVSATRAGESTTEFWPEVDIWWRLSPQWRLSSYIPFSENLETNYREGQLVLQADYAWGTTNQVFRTLLPGEDRERRIKPFMVRGGLLGGKSLGDDGAAYTEKTAYLEWHLRRPFKNSELLSHRLRAESRWLGADAEHSYRLRYRLTFEREYVNGDTLVVPFASVEPYYDSRYDTVNRWRLVGGAVVGWSPQTAVETNVTYQYDSRSSVTNLYALNVILHLYFQAGGLE